MAEDLKIDNEIRDILIKRNEEILEVRDKASFQILDLTIKSIGEKKDWFKHLTTISSAVIGLLALFQSQAINHGYLLAGILLNLFLVIFILSFLKDSIDKESLGLQESNDRYSTIADNQKKIISSYLEKPNLEYKDLKEYFSESTESSDIKELQTSIEKNKEKIKNRDNQYLDYTGEFVIFIFTTGLFFIILAFMPGLFNNQNILIILFVFLLAAFFNFHSLVMKPVNKISNYFYIKLKKNKK